MSDREKIIIIDDHPVVLDGLVLSLGELMVNGHILTALTGAQARELVTTHRDVDWIFVDVNLPDIDGIELIKEFEAMKVTANIVVLSSDSNPSTIDRALNQHASGFLSKSFDRKEMECCITDIEQGRIYVAPDLKRLLKHYRDGVLKEKQSIEEKMSDRQFQTLQLLANGYTNQEIATSLDIVESTVKSHVHALMTLFDADNRTHCAAEARRLSIIL